MGVPMAPILDNSIEASSQSGESAVVSARSVAAKVWEAHENATENNSSCSIMDETDASFTEFEVGSDTYRSIIGLS